MTRRITVRLNKLQIHRLRHQAVSHHVTNSQIIRALIMTTDSTNDLTNRKRLDHIHQLLACVYSELLSRQFDWKIGINDLNQANKSLSHLARDHQKLSVQSIQSCLVVIKDQLTDLLNLSKQEMIHLANLEKN